MTGGYGHTEQALLDEIQITCTELRETFGVILSTCETIQETLSRNGNGNGNKDVGSTLTPFPSLLSPPLRGLELPQWIHELTEMRTRFKTSVDAEDVNDRSNVL